MSDNEDENSDANEAGDVRLLVDANILLDFYRMPLPERLLAALEAARDGLLITEQIRDEVLRNRVEVVAEQLKELGQRPVSKIPVPDLLLGETPGTAEDSTLVAELRAHGEAGKQVKKALSERQGDLVRSVSAGNDPISLRLQPLLDRACAPTNEEVERARGRKECGNPPGKKADPLGDQITWEQVLSRGRDIGTLIIASKDADFGVTVARGAAVLHAPLQQDLHRASVGNAIFTADLAEALRQFEEHRHIEIDVPTDEEIEEATGRPSPFMLGMLPGQPHQCPGCGSGDTFTGGSYLRSQYGGLTLQFVCTKCGFRYDTGDPWD